MTATEFQIASAIQPLTRAGSIYAWRSKRDLNPRPVLTEYPRSARSFSRNSGESLPSESLFANDSAEIYSMAETWIRLKAAQCIQHRHHRALDGSRRGSRRGSACS